MQALRSLSFASTALGSCRVPAPAFEPGAGQHAAAPACNSAFAGQLRKRHRLFAVQVRQIRQKRARRPQRTPGALPDVLLPVVMIIHHCNGRRWTIASCFLRSFDARPMWPGVPRFGEYMERILALSLAECLFCLFLLPAFRLYFSQWTSAR